MSKKEKVPSTPEMREQKLADKKEVRKAFKKTFFPALAICLSLLLIYSLCYIAFFRPANEVASEGSASGNQSSSVVSSDSSNSSNSSSDSSSAQGSGSSDTQSSDSQGSASSSAVTEISSSSSTADVLSYFNTAINKVKPNAKQITLNKETNKEAGGISGNLPSSLTSIANSLIASNMGDKDLSKLEPEKVNATTVEAKNAMFPVENESWSSKLTADDVDSAKVEDGGSTYTITINVKADEPSADTAHGAGHAGKVFSVIMPSIVTDNAGPASSLIKNVKTGHKDGFVKVTVDKATGNVTEATYSFVWTLELSALGADLSIPFGLEKNFTIAW